MIFINFYTDTTIFWILYENPKNDFLGSVEE